MMVDRVPFVVESIYQVEGITQGTPIYITKFVPAEAQAPCMGPPAIMPANPMGNTQTLKTVFPGNVSLARSVAPLLLNGAGTQKFTHMPSVTTTGQMQSAGVAGGTFFPTAALQQDQSKPLMVASPDTFAQQFGCPVRQSLSISPLRYQQVMSGSSAPVNDVNAEFLSHIVGLVSAVPRTPRTLQQVCIGPSLQQSNLGGVPPPPQSPSITSSVSLQPNIQQVRVATPPVSAGVDRQTVVISVPAPSHPQFSNSISTAGFPAAFQQAQSQTTLSPACSAAGSYPVLGTFSNPSATGSFPVNIQPNRAIIPLPFNTTDPERFSQFANTVPSGSIANVPTSLAMTLQQSSAMSMQPVLYPSFPTQNGIAIVTTSAAAGEITEILETPNSPSVDSSHQDIATDVEMEMQTDISPETVSTTCQTTLRDQEEEFCEDRFHSEHDSPSICSKSSQASCENITILHEEPACNINSQDESTSDISDIVSGPKTVDSNDSSTEEICTESPFQNYEKAEPVVVSPVPIPVPDPPPVNSNSEDKGIETCNLEESDRRALQAYLSKQEVGPFQCEDCGKLYSQHLDLERHMWKHTGEKLTAYSESKMSYDSSLATNQKTTKSTDKCYCCKWCGAAFRRIVSLRKHVGTHSKHLHTCEQCGKTFATKEDLSNHIRNHSGAKSLFCGECGRVFMERAKLKNHIKEHQKQWLGIITRIALNAGDS